MNRRKFLKYTGAAGAVIGASALGIDYVLSPRPGYMNQTTTSLSQTTSSSKTNHPPRFLWPPLNMKPKYILPTPQYTLELSPNAIDDDNDPLSFTWSVDGKEVSHENGYSTKLAEGDHEIDLTASDGKASAFSKSTLTVETDQLYPLQSLHLRYKGTSYYVGNLVPGGPRASPTEEEMNEQLDTIRNDLGCNAIIVTGLGEEWEDEIIKCSELAIEKRFDRVHIQPRYLDRTVDETIEKIGKFAPNVRSLREKYGDVVGFSVGHELLFKTAIIGGSDYWERVKIAMKDVDTLNKAGRSLAEMFKKIIAVCNKNYGYPITYAATPYEAYENLVPWSDPAFEAIGVDTYITEVPGITNDENWWFNLLSSLKLSKKPILSMDWGMMSYKDADKWGGLVPMYVDENPYDEEPQVRYTKRILDMLNRARIDGCFWIAYDDAIPEGHGLYSAVTRKRKKGFYMYKSYQRSS